ncbi:CUB domain-containing protein 1 [Misgurnus anguillicaudatus]|uniref:CUB domain-containing protein 1 n=1 Tax=Misgurnus anguillicaudatus TaxID=75329 RepID=UPI003CCF142F
MGSCLVAVFIGLVLMQVHTYSECYQLDVKPDLGTVVIFRRKADQASDCSVCTGEGSSQNCGSELRLKGPAVATVNFNCTQPGDVYTVEINQDIDCASKSCKNINPVHPDSTRFLNFTRTFTWDVKVQPTQMIQLDFPAPGMRQIKPSEQCLNKHTYTIIAYQRLGPITIGTFCRNGTVNRIQILYRGRVSLVVAKGTDLSPSDFKVSVGSDTNTLFEVDAKLPRGESSENFFTPNYATGFFRKYKIKWNFAIEPLHNFTVKYVEKTEPECETGAVSLDYFFDDTTVITRTLKEDPPVNKLGSFDVTLDSCDAKKNLAGLLLNFEVSVFRGGIPNLCTVDLQKEGLSLQIEKINPQSYCEMKMNSVVQEKIVVPTGSKAELSFLDCTAEDLQLMATKTIDCSSGSECAVGGTALTIPTLDTCLPAPLHQFTWLLRVPDQGSVDLTSPLGNLHQSVPDKECNEKISLLVSENNDSNIGKFCFVGEGAIQKIQIIGNANITATPKTPKDLSQDNMPSLKAILNPQILKNTVCIVSPLVTRPTYLATPNWPDGMMPSSSVKWLVAVPDDYQADIAFDVTKPKCDSGHAAVEIEPFMSQEPKPLSWNEDQKIPSTIIQQQSFYLNMYNCEPNSGKFAVLSKITLQKETKKILGIILGIVGALLLLLIIAIIAIWFVRKKKKPRANRSSIFMPRGQPFLPGNATFPKTRADNESHVYASIEDPVSYGGLLNKDQTMVDGDTGAWTNGHQVDTYHPFTGPTDSVPAAPESSLDRGDGRAGNQAYQAFLNPASTFISPRPRSPLISQSSLGFEDRRMAKNELNTFKGAGDLNPIRLSTDESRLQLQPDSDSDSFAEPEYEEAPY